MVVVEVEAADGVAIAAVAVPSVGMSMNWRRATPQSAPSTVDCPRGTPAGMQVRHPSAALARNLFLTVDSRGAPI